MAITLIGEKTEPASLATGANEKVVAFRFKAEFSGTVETLRFETSSNVTGTKALRVGVAKDREETGAFYPGEIIGEGLNAYPWQQEAKVVQECVLGIKTAKIEAGKYYWLIMLGYEGSGFKIKALKESGGYSRTSSSKVKAALTTMAVTSAEWNANEAQSPAWLWGIGKLEYSEADKAYSTDASSRSVLLGRTIADKAEDLEATPLNRTLALTPRTAADAAVVAPEVITRTVNGTRSTNDESHSLDAYTLKFTGYRFVTDTELDTDVASRASMLFLRPVSDKSKLEEAALTELHTLYRKVSDESHETDSLEIAGHAYKKFSTETMTISDAPVKVSTFVRSIADTNADSDGITTLVKVFQRSPSDTSLDTDTVARTSHLTGRTVQDTSIDVDTLLKTVIQSRQFTDKSFDSDNLVASKTAHRATSDLSEALDHLVAGRNTLRFIADELADEDAISKTIKIYEALRDVAKSKDFMFFFIVQIQGIFTWHNYGPDQLVIPYDKSNITFFTNDTVQTNLEPYPQAKLIRLNNNQTQVYFEKLPQRLYEDFLTG